MELVRSALWPPLDISFEIQVLAQSMHLYATTHVLLRVATKYAYRLLHVGTPPPTKIRQLSMRTGETLDHGDAV